MLLVRKSFMTAALSVTLKPGKFYKAITNNSTFGHKCH